MERAGEGRAAVVLLSGGLDSATTLAEAIARGFEAHALTFRYGQRHGLEVERARALAARLGASSHRILDLDFSFAVGNALTDPGVSVPRRKGEAELETAGIPVTYVPARNTVFLALALALGETLGAGDLFLGVNAVDYSGYPDCRPEFIRAFERMARLATRAGVEGAEVRIHAPLQKLDKASIVRRAVELGVDPGLTLSCYEPSGTGEPCRRCDSCRLRERGFREAGIEDPALR